MAPAERGASVLGGASEGAQLSDILAFSSQYLNYFLEAFDNGLLYSPMRKIRIPENLTTLAFKAIKDYIWEGNLDEGARLTEESLSRWLGISKSPIREALNRLEAEGLIRIEQRRGAYLRKFSIKEIGEIYDVRGALEVHAVAAVQVTPDLIERLRESVERLKEHKERNDKFRHLEEAVNFHSILASGTGNDYLAKLLDTLHCQVWQFRRESYDASKSNAYDSHKAIVDALARGDKTEAQRFMSEHISGVGRKLIAQLSISRQKQEAAPVGPIALSRRP